MLTLCQLGFRQSVGGVGEDNKGGGGSCRMAAACRDVSGGVRVDMNDES